MTFEKALSYDDISIVPRVISEQEHRNGDTSIECFGIKLDVPIIASPMPDVCNGWMAHKLATTGALGIIHRFQKIEEQVKQYQTAGLLPSQNIFQFNPKYCACAIGVTDDYQERFKALYNAGCRIFCLDTANGANRLVEKAVKWIRKQTQLHVNAGFNPNNHKVYLIAGNVATREGYKFLADLGVDAVRVGIAGGSVCETKNETGVYMPMVTSILECVDMRYGLARGKAWSRVPKDIFKAHPEYITMRTDVVLDLESQEILTEEIKKLPLIIADGGIKIPADMNKALGLGADLVMAGGIFAGTKESPGDVLKDRDGKLYKIYRGAASFGVQKETTGEEPDYNEGAEIFVPYKHMSVTKVIKRFKAGLQSCMSYCNSVNLQEFKRNVKFVEV